MDNTYVTELVNEAIKITVMLSAPMLIGALVVGILISLFQAVTQINEQTLSFVPKILAIIVAMVVLSPWMMETITSYTFELYTSIPSVVRGQ